MQPKGSTSEHMVHRNEAVLEISELISSLGHFPLIQAGWILPVWLEAFVGDKSSDK